MTTAFWYHFLGVCVALAATLAITPILRKRALAVGLVDLSDGERKLHVEPVPRIGGVAISIATILAIGTIVLSGDASLFLQNMPLVAAIVGGFGVHLIGFWDDIASIRARYKLIWQLVIASLVFAAGLRIETLVFPLLGEVTFPFWASYLSTMLWLVGVTNAFNLIDGLDGLASGIAVIALSAMALVALTLGNTSVALTALLITAATLGFLRYNFAPASIFLGDSGSLFLGFMLASLGLLAAQTPSGTIPLMTPILILGIPGIDTALAILRRFLRGQKIFDPDRGHIHHRLLHLGFSPRQAVLRLYAAGAGLAVTALMLNDYWHSQALILITITAVTLFAIHRLRFQEFEELGRLVRRRASRESIRRNIRIREASQSLQSRTDLKSTLALLEKTFFDDGLEAAEIQLRPTLVNVWPTQGGESRPPEDRILWTWRRSPQISDECWKVVWPLLDDAGTSFGALVIWQSSDRACGSLSQLNVISEHLREELERTLLRLWWSGELPIPARFHPASATTSAAVRRPSGVVRVHPKSSAETVA